MHCFCASYGGIEDEGLVQIKDQIWLANQIAAVGKAEQIEIVQMTEALGSNVSLAIAQHSFWCKPSTGHSSSLICLESIYSTKACSNSPTLPGSSAVHVSVSLTTLCVCHMLAATLQQCIDFTYHLHGQNVPPINPPPQI